MKDLSLILLFGAGAIALTAGGAAVVSEALGGDVSPLNELNLPNMPQDVIAQITSSAERYGVDPNVAVWQAWYESQGDQSEVSSAGAIGIFQLEPSTAAGLGVDPYDQSQNIDGGMKYLSQLLKSYSGNYTLALAAYNAGPGNVAKYGNQVPPFQETQDYVSNILGASGAGA